MARIFYRTTTGSIYGVHPGVFSGTLPPGIAFIDVAETPDQIAWPDVRGEKYCEVQGGLLIASPTAAPPPKISATGAQMIDEAKDRNKLTALLAVLTASERATFYTRRRIVAGSPFAEVLRSKLGVSASAMESFIATAAARTEV